MKIMNEVKEYQVTIDDTYMHVIRFGKGSKKLLIIAGMSLCGLEGQGEALYKAYGEFKDDYTVYVLERRKAFNRLFNCIDMADDIYEVCKKEGIDKADIIGASQGGMIGLCLAIYHPDFVNKLVLCSSQCKTTAKMRKFCVDCDEIIEQKDIVALNRYCFSKIYSKKFLKLNEAILPVLEKQGTIEDCMRYKVLTYASANLDLLKQMDKVKCPVFVIGDENDETIGVEGSLEIVEALKCPYYIYSEYSHAVYDEAPDIKNRIRNFLIENQTKQKLV